MKKITKTVELMANEMRAASGRLRNLGRYLSGSLKTPEVAGNPHRNVLEINRSRLLEYTLPGPRTHRAPLLFVPSLVNRHYILDLIPERSVIGYMQHKGFKSYLLDWGVPGFEDRKTSLADYIVDRLDWMVGHIIREEGMAPTLVGYCMGGSMVLDYAALYPEKVRNIVLLATPVDFSKAGKLQMWANRDYFDLDRFVDASGLIPPDVLNQAFTMLKPSWQYRNLYSLVKFGWNDEFLKGFMAISKWVNDPVPVAGEAFREYVQDYYRDNRMVEGSLKLRGSRLDFTGYSGPVLNIIAEKDHIVPPESSRAIELVLTGSNDLETKTLPVGHIGLSVGQGAFSLVWKHIAAWLATRSA